MVGMKSCIVLWLVGVNFSRSPESYIDGTAISQHAQDAIMNNIGELKTFSHERLDGECADVKTRHSSLGSPSKRFKVNDKEAEEYNENQKFNSKSEKRRLSEERRAKIKQNMAMHQEEFASLKAEGEPMRKLLDVVMTNKEMLEKYGQLDGEKSFTDLLKQLKEVQRDINEVVQVWFRNWAGLGGWVLEPANTKKIDGLSQGSKHDSIQVFDERSKKKLKKQLNLGSPQSSDNKKGGKNITRAKIQEFQSSKTCFSGLKKYVWQNEAKKEVQPQLNDSDLEKIYKKAVESRVQELNEILHSVKFPHYFRRFWGMDMEEIRAIKLSFEMYIFQAIGFMYKHRLIKEETFKSFFSTARTLECIGKHLVDVYNVRKYGLYHEDCFIPDIEFLSSHWKTKHIHTILRGLGKSQQAHVIATSLIYDLKLFNKAIVVDGEKAISGNESIIKIKGIKALLLELESFLPREYFGLEFKSTNIGLPVEKFVSEIIRIFQDSHNWGSHRTSPPKLMEIEFKFIYHIIQFIKTYYIEHLGSCFKNEILQKQLELLREGMEIQQIIKQVQTYNCAIPYKNNKLHTVSKYLMNIDRNRCLKEYAIKSKRYKVLEFDFGKASKYKPTNKNWFQGKTTSSNILDNFNKITSSWKLGLEIESKRRKIMRKMHHSSKKWIKKDYFNDSVSKINLMMNCCYVQNDDRSEHFEKNVASDIKTFFDYTINMIFF